MIKANIILEHNSWKNKIKNPNRYVENKLKILSKKSYFRNKKHEFSILLTNNNKMKNLNKKFRKKNKPTDVLSFPINIVKKRVGYLGDIAISYEIVNKRSKKSNFNYEFDKMWVHGYLHLLGYDHKKIREFEKMHKLEKKILNYIERTN